MPIASFERLRQSAERVEPYQPISATQFSAESSTGTMDDDDGRDDERDDENEIPIHETSELTEAPEEFETDDEDADPEIVTSDEIEDDEFADEPADDADITGTPRDETR